MHKYPILVLSQIPYEVSSPTQSPIQNALQFFHSLTTPSNIAHKTNGSCYHWEVTK